jgi:riboflavin transporter FmnP
MLLGIRWIYWVNTLIGGLISGITIALLKHIIAEPYAFGLGLLPLFLAGYPLSRASARAKGRQLSFARYLLACLVGVIVATVLYSALL